MPRVYIPNRSSHHDYDDARQYGDLVYVTGGRVNHYNTGSIVRAWEAALIESTPYDYIIMTSLATICAIGAGMYSAKHERLNLLLYTKEGKYRRREHLWIK